MRCRGPTITTMAVQDFQQGRRHCTGSCACKHCSPTHAPRLLWSMPHHGTLASGTSSGSNALAGPAPSLSPGGGDTCEGSWGSWVLGSSTWRCARLPSSLFLFLLFFFSFLFWFNVISCLSPSPSSPLSPPSSPLSPPLPLLPHPTPSPDLVAPSSQQLALTRPGNGKELSSLMETLIDRAESAERETRTLTTPDGSDQ